MFVSRLVSSFISSLVFVFDVGFCFLACFGFGFFEGRG
jgi:hypothetical protein